MESIYYTTNDLAKMWNWTPKTVKLKVKQGYFPEPDIHGRPNKWLKRKINAIIEELEAEA